MDCCLSKIWKTGLISKLSLEIQFQKFSFKIQFREESFIKRDLYKRNEVFIWKQVSKKRFIEKNEQVFRYGKGSVSGPDIT